MEFISNGETIVNPVPKDFSYIDQIKATNFKSNLTTFQVILQDHNKEVIHQCKEVNHIFKLKLKFLKLIINKINNLLV